MQDMDQRELARAVVEALESSGDFQSVELIGSIAEEVFDAFSDIDILIADDRRPPYGNVELASSIIDKSFGLLLRDWAKSLIPNKYLINHFIPGYPIFWWIDIGCFPSPRFADISVLDVAQDMNEHFAKVLVMNAKHFLRGDMECLRIREIHRRLFRDASESLTEKGLFQQVYEKIDYSGISPEFREKTKKLMEAVMGRPP